MKVQSHTLACVMLVFSTFGSVKCGNILVWYTEASHWINLKPVLETLTDRGHSVTVLLPNVTLFMDATEKNRYSYEMFNVSLSLDELSDWMDEILYFTMYEMDKLNMLELYMKSYQIIGKDLDLCLVYCDGLLKSESVMDKLRKGRYDVLFVDPIFPCSRPTSFCEMMGKADIWLIRTYWDFEYPRPLVPNFKYVGGIHCRPAKPLPKDMEEFVESSGDDGVVVFSLGSMIKNMTKERANVIASALGQIPQKVLWRYSGEKPETLAPNTRLYDWIPQNDLLGHPKTKAFITHGGTNGIYEAIYHGVPMVGIPMFGDQPENMVHMKSEGAAVIMDFNSMETKDLVDGLKAVINDPSYKENAMRLSRIHHDRPVHPRDEAVFWIEFVMRHKGAKHLRVQAHNLTWYQYHSLDVFAFLLAIIALVLFIFYKILKSCVVRCCFRSRSKSKKE
ncbi:UDP-glucuronosyltransferase 2B11 isoform X7 [Chanos chanos]|uniref:UDP-glucuronosyltransferase n=1 Tax=Chanos chanos TaxID=29144 RepID=A0A6J2WU38_CHACN|nr:UDP-glucuronosyltransferase 2B11-like isoform X7 [Chanos chanos]